MNRPGQLAIVVPCYFEQEVLPETTKRLTKVLEDKDRPKYGEDRRIQRRERRQAAPAPAQPAPAAQAAPVAAPSVDLDALLG